MNRRQEGFTYIEIVVATAIISLITAAATMTIFSVQKDTERTNNRMTLIRQVENAGFWVGRDMLMADDAITENLTSPDVLIINWTDWGYDEDSIYHSVIYSIEDISGGVGTLKRTHQDSEGLDEQMLVAQYVYYDVSDPDNTSNISYQDSALTFKIVSTIGAAIEAREYQAYHRTSFQ